MEVPTEPKSMQAVTLSSFRISGSGSRFSTEPIAVPSRLKVKHSGKEGVCKTIRADSPRSGDREEPSAVKIFISKVAGMFA